MLTLKQESKAMAQTIRRVEYYYVLVPDKPGAGAAVLNALRDGGVNLLAYLGFPAGRGKSQLDLVPEDPATLKQVAKAARLKLSRAKRAFLVEGDDRIGVVADLAQKLAAAKVNITAACATGAGSGRYGMVVWVRPASYGKAAKALGA
jgi:predicted amino acid-binding ACT domain protein